VVERAGDNFIANQVGAVSTLLEPAVITLASVYVMMWGYLQLTGKIEEPILEGGRRILVLGVILVLTFKISQNIAPLLDVFVQGPQALAAGILGATPMAAVDTIWQQGSEVGDALLKQGSLFSESGLSMVASGLICYLVYRSYDALCRLPDGLGAGRPRHPAGPGAAYSSQCCSSTAPSASSRRGLRSSSNYALVIILVATIANLMLHAVSQPLQIAYNEGASVTGADALRVSLFCAFVVLIMTQILPMASGLASGVALSTGNIISGLVRREPGDLRSLRSRRVRCRHRRLQPSHREPLGSALPQSRTATGLSERPRGQSGLAKNQSRSDQTELTHECSKPRVQLRVHSCTRSNRLP
jgi:type IV secretion system protein VirB6